MSSPGTEGFELNTSKTKHSRLRTTDLEKFDKLPIQRTMSDYAKCKWCGKKYKKGLGLELKSIGTFG